MPDPEPAAAPASVDAPPTRPRPPLLPALAGFVPGVLLNAAPPLLVLLYVWSFTATATPDSGFNVFTLGALAFLLLDAALLLGALIALLVPATRAVGVGYLCGLLLVVLALVALAPFVG